MSTPAAPAAGSRSAQPAINPFNAVFDGNGYSIRNLAIRRDASDLGLFGIIGGNAAIRNLGLIDNLTDYSGSSGDPKNAGGLVGWQRGGSITASYATGDVDGGSGNQDRIGVLVGAQSGGSITASYATGNAAGGGGTGTLSALWWASRETAQSRELRHGQCRWRRRK